MMRWHGGKARLLALEVLCPMSEQEREECQVVVPPPLLLGELRALRHGLEVELEALV